MQGTTNASSYQARLDSIDKRLRAIQKRLKILQAELEWVIVNQPLILPKRIKSHAKKRKTKTTKPSHDIASDTDTVIIPIEGEK